jgi:hypothetical protein
MALNLEKLADKLVLARIDAQFLPLKHNNRPDVVLYMFEWAAMLEEELIKDVKLPAFLSASSNLELANA